MASPLSSNGSMSPHLGGHATDDPLPDFLHVAQSLSPFGPGFVNPQVDTPGALSRGAVVHATTAVPLEGAPLDQSTSRMLTLIDRGASVGLFNRHGPVADVEAFTQASAQDARQYRLVVALPDAHQLSLHEFTTRLMERVDADAGRQLDWVAATHRGGGRGYVDVLIRGRDVEGNAVELSQRYLTRGMTQRAMEVVTDGLGELPVLSVKGREMAARLREFGSSQFYSAKQHPERWYDGLQARMHQATRGIPSLTVHHAMAREDSRVQNLRGFAHRHARALTMAVASPVLQRPAQAVSPAYVSVVSRLSQPTQTLLQAHARRQEQSQGQSRSAGWGG